MSFLDTKNIVECQTCGNRDAKLIIERDGGYVCKSCGVWYKSNPTDEEFREQIRCEQGYAQLRAYRFGDARDTFQIMLQKSPNNINALWGLLLARFGVVYIKGFYKGVSEPIYCFPNYERMKRRYVQSEPEFLKIMELLKDDAELRFEYEKKAEKIDDALDNFKEYKASTERDVFICVKISAATEREPGREGRTKDYEFALKVYNELKRRGVNAFYSFVTLENDVKSDEKIWRNLVKSKKMLLIGSSEEYLESAWVKSEWKRWLHLRREEDMYVCVLHGNNESPFDILPDEIAELEQQIYTQNDYQRLIDNICKGVGVISAKEARKDEDARRAEEARKEEEARRAEAKIKAEAEAKAKAEAEMKARIEAEVKAKIEAEAKMRAEIEAKVRAEAKVEAEEIPSDIYSNEAKECYKKAIAGDAAAQNQLAGSYYAGTGVAKDLAKSVYWWNKAAEQGHVIAQTNLGGSYYNGLGVAKDLAKGIYWWNKAAEQGDMKAENELGMCYYNGTGIAKDLAKAVYWFTKSAEQGYAAAQNNLGSCYYHGFGAVKEPSKAIYWFAKSAEQGDANAQNNLGSCYYHGAGVAKDLAKAVYWYTKAAEQGNANARNNLGSCYYSGTGVAKDLAKAVYWFTKAAEQGDMKAQNNLGSCYYHGTGIAKDTAKAVYWYTKAAERGDANAQNNLGSCYYSGTGVAKDLAKMIYWYTKAAEQGNAAAQNNLGACYYSGTGVAKDLAKAEYWYTKAAAQGYEKAKTQLSRMKK